MARAYPNGHFLWIQKETGTKHGARRKELLYLDLHRPAERFDPRKPDRPLEVAMLATLTGPSGFVKAVYSGPVLPTGAVK